MERLCQELGPRGQEHPATHRRRKPFVRVDGEGIRRFEARQRAAQPVGRDQGAGPGGVNMTPKAMATRNIDTVRERIDHSRICGAGSRDDHHRDVSGHPISDDRLLQSRDVHAAEAVGRDEPHR